jgi:RNA polymerase-associated protein
MLFYSDGSSQFSHRVRIVLAEKGVTVEIVDVDIYDKPEDLAVLNPYNSLPTLVDRDLVLYEPNIMMEYLDERFPHPPLLPVDPVARANARLFMYRVERDWFALLDRIVSGDPAQAEPARSELRNSLIATAPVFGAKRFFMSDELSLVDCCIAPLLWRLPVLGIELPAQAKEIHDYTKRIFKWPAFKASLTEAEHEMIADLRQASPQVHPARP